MKVSIIHPSRGRSQLAAKAAKEFIMNAGYGVYEYILSLDNDDNINSYHHAFRQIVSDADCSFVFTCNNNNNVVDAMNAGAKVSEGDLLVCVSDDFEPCFDWLSKIVDLVDVTKKQAVKINDTYSKVDEVILTLPIITRPLYDELSYIYYPHYTGMFADNDLAELCELYGYLIRASHIEIKHNHYTRKRSLFDSTYKRHNNKTSWDLGQQIIRVRRLNGFSK